LKYYFKYIFLFPTKIFIYYKTNSANRSCYNIYINIFSPGVNMRNFSGNVDIDSMISSEIEFDMKNPFA